MNSWIIHCQGIAVSGTVGCRSGVNIPCCRGRYTTVIAPLTTEKSQKLKIFIPVPRFPMPSLNSQPSVNVPR